MIFTPLALAGAFLIDLERREDERGFFARTWCQREFVENGINPALVQCNLSYNRMRGTLRGMHLQLPPFEEDKLVRCSRGAIYDVIIDLRIDSPTWRQWIGVMLNQENRRALYVPKGFAHGFLTLEDETEVFYQMSEFYAPEHSRGVRWDDPVFGITWPIPVATISEKDQALADYRKEDFPLYVSGK